MFLKKGDVFEFFLFKSFLSCVLVLDFSRKQLEDLKLFLLRGAKLQPSEIYNLTVAGVNNLYKVVVDEQENMKKQMGAKR